MGDTASSHCARVALMYGGLLILILRLGAAAAQSADAPYVLFNWTDSSTTSEFYEVSDTVRTTGMSKASLGLTESREYRWATFLAVLNPQASSACFAGMETAYNETLDFSPYQVMVVNGRIQGDYAIMKIVLENPTEAVTFEQFFKADGGFSDYKLPLADFECHYRGDACSVPFDPSKIRTFGVQAAGGVYETFTQSGVAAFEMQYVYLE
mmetsp:Transcript_34088/g.95969  ORF Transcript_34088/g.95969 Transcript_34088/m.95969 type:complete len:210 (-) Transcript_34088:3039-3668(-)